MAQFRTFRDCPTEVNGLAGSVNRCIVSVMITATETSPATTLETMIRQIITEVIEQMDWETLVEPKLAYTPAQAAEVAGFMNGLAVEREAKAGRLIGSKVRNKWVFTRDQLRKYLQEQEVTV